MIVFTAGGAMYEAFAAQYPCERISIREEGAEALAGRLSDGDVLVHNAASIAPADWSAAVRDNFQLTKDLADALQASKKQVRLVFISSMSMLGKNGCYKNPAEMNAYAFSKYIAELYCLKAVPGSVCVRFSTLYYKNPSRDGLSKMITDAVKTRSITLINEGRDTRDFIPLTTAVQYLYKVCGAQAPKSVYNIASGDCIPFAGVAAMIREALPDVTISSTSMPPSPVFILSEFGREDIHSLGPVPLELKEHIHQYIRELI
ncbi:MAG TPA: NAD(P)-dependent oxidoreductase [Puia sp.]